MGYYYECYSSVRESSPAHQNQANRLADELAAAKLVLLHTFCLVILLASLPAELSYKK